MMINIKKPLDLRYRHLIPQRIREYAFHIYDQAIVQHSVNRDLQLYVTLLAHAEHLLREAPPDSPWWRKTNKSESKRKALDLLRKLHDWEENPQKLYEIPTDRESDRGLLLAEYSNARNSNPYASSDEWENKFRRLEKCPAPFFLTYLVDNQLDNEVEALKRFCSTAGDGLPEIQLLPDECGLSLEMITTSSWPQRFLGTNIIDDDDTSYPGYEWGKFGDDGLFILHNEALLGDFEDRYALRPVFVTEHCQNICSLQQELERGEINYLLEELKRLVGIKELNVPNGWSLVNNELQLNPNSDRRYAQHEQIASFSTAEYLGGLRELLTVNRVKSQVFGDAVWTAPVGGYTIPWRSNWSKLANRDIYIFKFGECASEELTRQLLDVAAAIVRDIGVDSMTRIEAATKLNFVIMQNKISHAVSENDIQLLKLNDIFNKYVSTDTLVPEDLQSVYEDYLRKSKRRSQSPYIVEPVIRRNSWCLLTGVEGTGKTYLGMALGAAIAGNGRLFGNWKVRRRNCKVLYITDDEMSENVIRDRLNVLKKLYPSSKKRFFVEQVRHLSLLDEEDSKDTSENINKETGKEKIEKLLLKYSRENDDSPVEVLFLDHLLKLSKEEGAQKEHWPKIRSWIEELTRRGLSVVLLHHEYGGGKMLGTRLIANDTPARIHLQPLHELRPKTKSEREESKYSDKDFVLEEDEVGFGLSIIKNRGGRDQKEPRIVKLNIGKHPCWISDTQSTERVETPLWKSLSKEQRLAYIQELRNQGCTNVEIAKRFDRSTSTIEQYVTLLPDEKKHHKGPKPQSRRDSNETSTEPVSPTDHEN